MKKLLGILVLGFILSGNAFATSSIKINYESHTAVSFNEIFNNNYSSKPVTLSGDLYLPKKEMTKRVI
jgi:hypothetical protein